MRKPPTWRLANGCAAITALVLAVQPVAAETTRDRPPSDHAAVLPAAMRLVGETVPAPPRYLPSAGLTATEITFAGVGTVLHGSIVRRADIDTSVRHPGIVLVHGSGVGIRAELTQEAEAFARAGIVTLIYDKRGDYSKFHRDFSTLADDALAALHVLSSSANVDPAKVGLWGFSEGGWIAPLAASRSTDVRFLVTLSASGLSPSRTQAWHLANRLRHAGVGTATADTLAARGVEVAAGLGAFPAAGYDPIPTLHQVRQPVLALWGEQDVVVPPHESAVILGEQLTASPSVTLRILPGASHGARMTPDGYELPGGPTIGGHPDGQLTPGYVSMVSAWVQVVTSGSPPPTQGGELPEQQHGSIPLAPVAWRGLGLFGLLLVTLLSWPAGAAVRRMRGQRSVPQGARAARWLTATGLATVLGSVGGVVFILVGQGEAGPVLGDQPLIWLLLRLVLVGALVSAALLARSAWRGRTTSTRAQRLRVGLLLVGGVLLLPYGVGMGLLLP